MDPRTLSAYATHAPAIARQHAGAGVGIARHFRQAFSQGDRILEIGTGSGRDLAQLVAEGWDARGSEPVAEMRAEATRSYPHLADVIADGGLPDGLGTDAWLSEPFEGIVCSAVLQHLPRASLFDAVFRIRELLKVGGRVLVSTPGGRTGLDESGRDNLGRLFNGVHPGELELLFQRVGFRTIGRWDDPDSLGRDGHWWATRLFELACSGTEASTRPLARIEAVLRRDKKVTTYKLALLRALTEIATSSARSARWRADDKVEVPIKAVADLWLEYYWQLFDSELFLPQGNGEFKNSTHRLGFATQLQDLRGHFAAGGLAAFLTSHRQGRLDREASKLLAKVNAKLKNAIRAGPVQHAGRSTSGVLFGYERQKILVPGELWQEITLMSHWVRESLLVRWAERSAGFARSGGADGDRRNRVLETTLRILLTPALAERHTRHAREIFEALPDKRCTWSDEQIGSTFDVDHVIPFSLWRNNDLWNLLPAATKVNQSKSDRLPTRRLLQARRPAIIDYWQCLAEGLPKQFEVEFGHLTGNRDEGFEGGFEALVEAVETTALQRGCDDRWDFP